MATANQIAEAARVLRGGGLVILPTETVYGLAADATNAAAIAEIFRAKGRPAFNPLIVHVADLLEAEEIACFDEDARRLAERFWPGPLTLVLPAKQGAEVCDLARAGLPTVALRVPAHPVARALLQAFGGPLAAPSANRSGRPSPTTFTDAMEETGSAAAGALDGGDCRLGVESTVLGVFDGHTRLLRPGALTRSEIESVCEPLASDEGAASNRSPGRLATHYAPRAPVRLAAAAPREGEAFLAFGSAIEGPGVWNLSPSCDLAEAAHRLFAALRAADRTDPVAIAVAPIPETGLGEAINDRLRRAAGYVG